MMICKNDNDYHTDHHSTEHDYAGQAETTKNQPMHSGVSFNSSSHRILVTAPDRNRDRILSDDVEESWFSRNDSYAESMIVGTTNMMKKKEEDEYEHEDEHESSEVQVQEDDFNENHVVITPEIVIQRIEDTILTESILKPLGDRRVPTIQLPQKSFLHATHCRSMTSMVLVADFCHELLMSNRTTTIREVYYHFVTHFRNQAECDKAIWDLATALRVPRSSLGLVASPKGWCCGCLELYNQQTGDLMWNGRVLDVHGIAITMSLMQATVHSHDARCILVIEKEGVYTRLSEDKFFQQYPCILVTGKGFPDIATRLWVQHLQRILNLPVYGLCDNNPYGISILHTYQYDQEGQRKVSRRVAAAAVVPASSSSSSSPCSASQGGRQRRQELHEERPHHDDRQTTTKTFQMKWLGLRTSQLEELDLPPLVFQQQTHLDKKRLESLRNENHVFQQNGNSRRRIQELKDLENSGHKVELEALNWLGMDFLCRWVLKQLKLYEKEIAAGTQETSVIII